jgi:hypothetical protein
VKKESLFRCCGRPKTPENTGRRLLQGHWRPYCRACRNARDRRYRQAHRATVTLRRLRKRELTVSIPPADMLRLGGMLADMVAFSHLADADWGEGRDILVAAYELGYARAVVVVHLP